MGPIRRIHASLRGVEVAEQAVSPADWLENDHAESLRRGTGISSAEDLPTESENFGTSVPEPGKKEVLVPELVSTSQELAEADEKQAQIELHHRSKFTPQVCDAIVTAVRRGLPPTHAGPKAGVSRATVSRWLRLGEEDPMGPYGEFLTKVQQAEADHLDELLEEWRTVGGQTKQWTALATLAERRYADDFAKRNRTGPAVQTNVQVNVSGGQLERNLHQVHGSKASELDIYDGG